jgi:hypothetical protein
VCSAADADVDAMFCEYCRLFYGPAEQEMLAFFTYCEANWAAMEEDKTKADTALAMFDKAMAKADAGSVYGRRIAFVDDFLKGLRMKAQPLGQKRGPVRLVGEASSIERSSQAALSWVRLLIFTVFFPATIRSNGTV